MDNLNEYKKAGLIASNSLMLGQKLIKKEKPIVEILDEIEDYIKKQGAMPAFPAQISLDRIAAHQCSVSKDDLIGDNVIKLDVGVHIDGFIADNALTINKKDDSGIEQASRKALNEALKLMRPNTSIKEVSRVISQTIIDEGFSPVKNLSGHGLDQYKLHKSPSIPNVPSIDKVLKENDVFAVEPFASSGTGVVKEAGINTLFTLIKSKPVRNPITRNVLLELKKYKGLPFTSRWLINKFGEGKTNFALRELNNLGVLEKHPPLADDYGLVSQAEHTVIVKDKPIITTKGE
ncbi:MAG: type II methionyl aminopeptidase [Candidatus Woesearchaeota archaeon]